MTIHYISGEESGLFRPLAISNGALTLRHRIIHAPLTRNRGVPLNPISTAENPNRIWVPGDLIADYYSQRATEGGLLISEGIPPSLEVCNCKFTPQGGWEKKKSYFCPLPAAHNYPNPWLNPSSTLCGVY